MSSVEVYEAIERESAQKTSLEFEAWQYIVCCVCRAVVFPGADNDTSKIHMLDAVSSFRLSVSSGLRM